MDTTIFKKVGTLCVALALVGVASPAGASSGPGMGVAKALLGEVIVPPGAELAYPPGAALCQCAGAPAVSPLVTLHHYYVVPGAPQALSHFLSTHVPLGGKESGEERGTLGNGAVVYSLTTVFKAAGPHVYLKQLAYSVAAKSPSTSWLRVDAQVVYVGYKGDSEVVGTASRAVVSGYKTVGLSGNSGKITLNVSGNALATLIAKLNALPLGPENNCMESLNGFSVDITLQSGDATTVTNGLCGGDFDAVSVSGGTTYVLADTKCGLIKYVASLFGKGAAGTKQALGECEAWEKAR